MNYINESTNTQIETLEILGQFQDYYVHLEKNMDVFINDLITKINISNLTYILPDYDNNHTKGYVYRKIKVIDIIDDYKRDNYNRTITTFKVLFYDPVKFTDINKGEIVWNVDRSGHPLRSSLSK